MVITPIFYPPNVAVITYADSPFDVREIDRVLICDTTAGTIVVNLKKLNALQIKKIETDTSDNEVTITPAIGQTIQNASTLSLKAPGENVEIILNDTNWEQFN